MEEIVKNCQKLGKNFIEMSEKVQKIYLKRRKNIE